MWGPWPDLCTAMVSGGLAIQVSFGAVHPGWRTAAQARKKRGEGHWGTHSNCVSLVSTTARTLQRAQGETGTAPPGYHQRSSPGHHQLVVTRVQAGAGSPCRDRLGQYRYQAGEALVALLIGSCYRCCSCDIDTSSFERCGRAGCTCWPPLCRGVGSGGSTRQHGMAPGDRYLWAAYDSHTGSVQPVTT